VISAYDAFVFGVCVGIIATLPIAILLHFVMRIINYKDNEAD